MGRSGSMDDYIEITRGEFDGTTGADGIFYPLIIPDNWKPGDTIRVHIRGIFGPMILGIEHLGSGKQTPNPIDKPPQSVV